MSAATKITNFKKLSRQNTGSHFLDSGGIYGRHWERKMPEGLLSLKDSSWTDKDGKTHKEFMASIHCGEFLDTVTEIDRELRRAFKKFCKRSKWQAESWWDCMDAFMQERGYSEVGGDNTYNHESDLDQCFQFRVYMPEGDSGSDWYYSDDAVLFIQTHNGCDVRGGYSEPIPVKPVGMDGFTDLLETVVGWSFSEGTDAKGNELDRESLQALDERLQVGYCSNPSYEFDQHIAETLEINESEMYVRVRLKSGETVKAYPNCRAEYI